MPLTPTTPEVIDVPGPAVPTSMDIYYVVGYTITRPDPNDLTNLTGTFQWKKGHGLSPNFVAEKDDAGKDKVFSYTVADDDKAEFANWVANHTPVGANVYEVNKEAFWSYLVFKGAVTGSIS